MSLYGKINQMAKNKSAEQRELFNDAMRRRLRDPWPRIYSSNNWSCGQLAQIVRSCNVSEDEIVGIATMIFQ